MSKLLKMQQPTSEIIREQVLVEMDKQLPEKFPESALKNFLKQKQKEKERV